MTHYLNRLSIHSYRTKGFCNPSNNLAQKNQNPKSLKVLTDIIIIIIIIITLNTQTDVIIVGIKVNRSKLVIIAIIQAETKTK